eukprot:4621080-Prymnesium_polylepis.1
MRSQCRRLRSTCQAARVHPGPGHPDLERHWLTGRFVVAATERLLGLSVQAVAYTLLGASRRHLRALDVRRHLAHRRLDLVPEHQGPRQPRGAERHLRAALLDEDRSLRRGVLVVGAAACDRLPRVAAPPAPGPPVPRDHDAVVRHRRADLHASHPHAAGDHRQKPRILQADVDR